MHSPIVLHFCLNISVFEWMDDTKLQKKNSNIIEPNILVTIARIDCRLFLEDCPYWISCASVRHYSEPAWLRVTTLFGQSDIYIHYSVCHREKTNVFFKLDSIVLFTLELSKIILTHQMAAVLHWRPLSPPCVCRIESLDQRWRGW